MEIQTFEIEEVKGELDNMAADSEAMEICRKLDLAGQLGLATPNETRFCYPRMTDQEFMIYSLMLPEQTPIGKYRGGIIPLRVLQVAAFCKDFPQTAHLEVWHPKIVKDDPLLVGRPNSYSSEYYLLARWGAMLEPLEKLVDKARPMWVAATRVKLDEIRAKVDGWEKALDNMATDAMLNGKRFEPYCHG